MARKAKVVKQEKFKQENIKKEVEEPKEELAKVGEAENLFGEDESGEEEY